jgi:phosphoglucosamine mutase
MQFGTDGVRGRVDVDLHESDVVALGTAVARVWPTSPIVIGHDGRESGAAWLAAFVAGVRDADSVSSRSVINAGRVPTPAIALWSHRHQAVGVVISASHNPWHDNGVKVFAPGGRKLSDDEQSRVEEAWHAVSSVVKAATHRAEAPMVDTDVANEYEAFLAQDLEIERFADMRVVVDCANGATSGVAERALGRLDIDTEVTHAEPNGRNINEHCGALHPERLAERCAATNTIGVAFDGDGDRLIAIDESGNVVDGDRIIALCAVDLRRRGLLTSDTVVVTTMSNLGLHQAMKACGIRTVVTDVGDRNVLSAMTEGGFVLGGEQSGHIVHARHTTTGDGLLSALILLDVVRRSGRSLSELASEVMTTFPQTIRNVPVSSKPRDVEQLLAPELEQEREALGDTGRIIVRASGTEPVVRIMIEAQTPEAAQDIASRLERLVQSRT